MPSTHSAVGDLVIVESPAMAQTTERDPSRGLQVAADSRVVPQPAGR